MKRESSAAQPQQIHGSIDPSIDFRIRVIIIIIMTAFFRMVIVLTLEYRCFFNFMITEPRTEVADNIAKSRNL